VSEGDLIGRIASLVGTRAGVLLGIGDDAAVLGGDGPWVVAHDMLVQDVHFRWSTCSPADVGHKALAVNLSDLAAMGATPVAVLVGLALPPDGPGGDDVAAMYDSMEALAAATGCSVVGGDVSAAAQTVLGVTVLGRPAPGVAPVTRAGARPGDLVAVTGALGASEAGRRILEDPPLASGLPAAAALAAAHRRPRPRLREGAALAAAGVRAMLDCSDGLAVDLDRLARASGVRAVLDLGRVPVAPGVAHLAARRGEDPAVAAATGGEDYELIVAAPAAVLEASGVALTVVGHVEAGAPGVAARRDGAPAPLGRLGWEHGVG
jgi:thiamine-monophosphate kinase